MQPSQPLPCKEHEFSEIFKKIESIPHILQQQVAQWAVLPSQLLDIKYSLAHTNHHWPTLIILQSLGGGKEGVPLHLLLHDKPQRPL